MTIAEGYAALLAAWLMAAGELDGTLTLVCLPQGPCRLTANFIRFTATSGPPPDRPLLVRQSQLADRSPYVLGPQVIENLQCKMLIVFRF